MDELEDYERDLLDVLEDANEKLKRLTDGKDKAVVGRERAGKIDYIIGRIKRCRTLLKSMKLEMRDLSRMEQDPWNKKIKKFEDDVAELQRDLDFAQEHNELTAGGKKKRHDPDAMTADEVLERAAAIQDQDIDILDGAIQTIEQTKQIGTDVGQELNRQTEQLRKASEHVKEIESNMDMANRELRSFIRRMATDKIILAFICLIILAIIGIIIFSLVDDSEETGIPDQFGGTNSSAAVSLLRGSSGIPLPFLFSFIAVVIVPFVCR